MRFTKMEGLGNDYIYLDCLEGAPEDLPKLAVRLSDRHFGVGADGLICIKPGQGGDFAMEMYNADGSRGAMCGNGIRCVGKYVYDCGLTRKTCLTIDTGAGPRRLELHVLDGAVDRVTVDMGPARVDSPVRAEAAGESFTVVPVDVGNPQGNDFLTGIGRTSAKLYTGGSYGNTKICLEMQAASGAAGGVEIPS